MKTLESYPSSCSTFTEKDETTGKDADGGTLQHGNSQDNPDLEPVSSAIKASNVKDLHRSVSPVLGGSESGFGSMDSPGRTPRETKGRPAVLVDQIRENQRFHPLYGW